MPLAMPIPSPPFLFTPPCSVPFPLFLILFFLCPLSLIIFHFLVLLPFPSPSKTTYIGRVYHVSPLYWVCCSVLFSFSPTQNLGYMSVFTNNSVAISLS